ncbi:alpha/beta hydrolase [Papillibacter cinnamivorans]|uniref:Serine aminopeptidase S33 domain-containing protein n=1 Tax=Papillibacter cinnamivorans DSM 12816 TaxID=1122930 RepID=A0A1W1ZGQ6_9FIRM|nr:alpha/beta fold hydrolase [Papillibacter cinnamivorans]SMC47567.1 hypothetical protein SAMN02745168_1072 [Papillibacter cinnamivorans DSM 12816]
MKRQKWICLLLCAGIFLGLTACGGTEKEGFDTEALEKDARQCVENLVSGDYDSVVGEFNATVSKQLDAKGLEDAWTTTVGSLGSFQEILEVTGEESKGYYVVNVLSRFEGNGLMTKLTYDSEGKIAGLWFSYQAVEAPEATSTDLYEEIPIQVGAGESKVDGFLTLPKNVEKPPVVIFIQGSGSTDMDETIGTAQNKPFQDLAWGLAEKGIASVRYNKRFYQYPDEATALGGNLTVGDEVLSDAAAAVALASSDERLDGDRIFILGHSLGGMLAPKIALDHPEVSGIISMAGTLRGLEDVILDQNREAIAAADMTDEKKQETLTQVEAEVQKVKALTQGDASVTILGISSVYWMSLKESTGTEIAERLTCPVLVLQGSADFQVYPDKDYPLWEETLKSKTDFESHLYDGLNHLFMTTNGKRDVTEYNIAGHVSQTVIDDIAAWIGRVSQS